MEDINKATTKDVERDDKGNLVYSGHKFAGYNKPKKSSRDGKDGMVLAKKGDQIKLVHFGDSSMPHNQSSEANDRYYDRFDAGNTDKFSAEYWSNKWLWTRGDMKGKGGKPWVSLKKSSEEQMSKENIVQLEKSALDGKSVVIYITNGDEAQSTSPDFYYTDITYQDDEYTVPESIQLATQDRSDILYLSRTEQHYEKGMGDVDSGILGNNAQRFTVEYVSINGIKIDSSDLTMIKNMLQATAMDSELTKQRHYDNSMKIVDEDEKPVKKYKKKKKNAVKKTTVLEFLSSVIGNEYEEDEDGYLFKSTSSAQKEEVSEEEEKVSYEVVYEPFVKDAHGQWMSDETIEKGCNNFNECLEKGLIKSNLFHMEDTDSYVIEKSWVQPELDLIVKESGEEIKAGTWVAKVKYKDDDLWLLKKAGVVQGLSMQCLGKVNKETGEITDLDFNITSKED